MHLITNTYYNRATSAWRIARGPCFACIVSTRLCADIVTAHVAHAEDSKRPKRYFPFAEGPRSCVGQSLAKVSLVATMATLMQHFHFSLADEVGSCSTLVHITTHSC